MKFIAFAFLYTSIVFFLAALFGTFVMWDFSVIDVSSWSAAGRASVAVVALSIGAVESARKLDL